ncbi:hypothetical protein Ari01nite_01710 [Paractinoplanes rishiriensis]|uniref:LemA family protein n=2 Tax=Paractinoplanes rishiriensis TaxID=1050105 RepID=A0A919MM87_9ACTN|nr:hypothetical protein Ari01nite_01710 [Actinoplanes rishiriensis]
MWWVLGAVAVVALLSAYLGWTAHRVERVHVRAQAAERALDAHLMRRAAAAAVVAEHHENVELYAAARLALDADPDERETAENDLTRQLQAVPLTGADPDTKALLGTSRRAVVARQVHTDQVRDALTARRRPLVRALGMARRYPRPQYFDIEDPALPEPVAAVPLESV